MSLTLVIQNINLEFSFLEEILADLYRASIAQLVEQGIENPCVRGSIPRRGTT